MKELTFDSIINELKNSNYSTKGIKIVVPIFLGIFLLIWIALTWNQGMLAFISTGVCFGFLFFMVIYMAVVSVRVSNAIEKRDFYIQKVAVVATKYKPGNAEDSPEFFFFFEEFGKYRLPGKGSDSVQVGDEYFVLLCGKSKKIRFIYDARKWQISDIDFIEKDGTYMPVKR